MERLFVYGSLVPGGSNQHVLVDLDGDWSKATVRGQLLAEGWGSAQGYPGIVLDEAGDIVSGHVLSSHGLSTFWDTLDEFEGEDYERRLTSVTLSTGERVEAYVYVLAPSGFPP